MKILVLVAVLAIAGTAAYYVLKPAAPMTGGGPTGTGPQTGAGAYSVGNSGPTPFQQSTIPNPTYRSGYVSSAAQNPFLSKVS